MASALPIETRALQWSKSERALQLVSVRLEDVADLNDPHAVIVRVHLAGVCGTDLHVLDGEFDTPPRVILGHEFVGVVAAIGSAVWHVTVGDRVVVNPNEACNRCRHCFGGLVHFCQHGSLSKNIGLARNGGMAEFCVVPDSVVHPLPAVMTLRAAVLVEPMSCVARGFDNLRKDSLTCSSRFLVLGAGIAGLLWALLLHHHGFRDITITEPRACRRRIAQELGIFKQVAPPENLSTSDADQPTDGGDHEGGFDVVAECSGDASAIDQALPLLRCGGQLCIFGFAHNDARVSLSPWVLLMKELSIVTSFLNPRTFPKAIAVLGALEGDKLLDFARLGVETFRLDDHKEAFERLRAGTIVKAVFMLA